MINDCFKIKLKSRTNGEELTIISSLLSQSNGLFHFPIELDKWDIVSCHQTTGMYDKNKKEIFFSDSIRFANHNSLYEVTINDFNKVAVVDGETGQMELHKCHNVIEVIGN